MKKTGKRGARNQKRERRFQPRVEEEKRRQEWRGQFCCRQMREDEGKEGGTGGEQESTNGRRRERDRRTTCMCKEMSVRLPFVSDASFFRALMAFFFAWSISSENMALSLSSFQTLTQLSTASPLLLNVFFFFSSSNCKDEGHGHEEETGGRFPCVSASL